VSLSTSIREFLDALVHPSARHDPFAAERHAAFMASRLFGSLLALGGLPLFLALHGVPSVLEFLLIAWMISPIATACFLSRTGCYDAALGLSAVALTAIVTAVAANSGGINSIAAIWLVLVPLEGALSGSRRAAAVAALLASGGAGLLIFASSRFGLGGVEHSTGMVAALGTVSALIYATGIAVGADALARANLARLGREAEQRLLPGFGPADVVTHHSHGGRIVHASANAQAVLGAPASDLKDYGLFDRIHIADRPAYLRALSEAASGDACEIEFRLRRQAAAEFVWIEMRCRPSDPPYPPRVPPSLRLPRKRGRVGRGLAAERQGGESVPGDRYATGPNVVAVMREVTARKIRQDALLEARTAAEHANAAKSRFLACMSHELRTPLTAIIGFSDLLRNENENLIDRARQLEYARIINESGHHLLAVANEILDMSRLETGNFGLFPQALRLDAVIASCAELLALKAQDVGIIFKIEAPSDLPDFVADRRAIMQILINLMTNAIKFSHRGAIVAVSASVDGPWMLLEVADNGIGIAPDDLARIGSPFFQAQGGSGRKQDGAGLGLSIVKALVGLHAGKFEAESRAGEGTRMVVRLPFDCTDAPEIRRPIPIANGIRGDVQKGLWGGLPASGFAADPSAPPPPTLPSPARGGALGRGSREVSEADGTNSTADLVFPVQRRA
jgi:two-component system, cell cycle sensor histidine kinase DivJ